MLENNVSNLYLCMPKVQSRNPFPVSMHVPISMVQNNDVATAVSAVAIEAAMLF